MTAVIVIGGIACGIVYAFVRALAIDEVRGRIQRRVARSVENTIALMPAELQAEWGEEWRAELASLEKMPFSSMAFARNLRKTAAELVTASELVPVGPGSSARSAHERQARGRKLLRLIVARFAASSSRRNGARRSWHIGLRGWPERVKWTLLFQGLLTALVALTQILLPGARSSFGVALVGLGVAITVLIFFTERMR